MKKVKGYLGASPDMFSNKTEIPFAFAPQKFLLNLETMKAVKAESVGASSFITFSVDDAIEACKAI